MTKEIKQLKSERKSKLSDSPTPQIGASTGSMLPSYQVNSFKKKKHCYTAHLLLINMMTDSSILCSPPATNDASKG